MNRIKTFVYTTLVAVPLLLNYGCAATTSSSKLEEKLNGSNAQVKELTDKLKTANT